MSPKISLAVLLGVVLIVGIFAPSPAAAQGPSPSSLDNQLKALYKLAKIVPESNGYRVAEPGTMLVVQKDGIFGVPLGSNSVDRVIYAIQKDTDLHHYSSGASNWKFGVGHQVYLSKVNIDAKRENVLFTIVECDCSDPAKPSYYKSVVDFEFPAGYLADAEVGQIEDVINQVLAIDSGSDGGSKGSRGASQSAPPRPEDPNPNLLTNDKIARMASVKMGDAVILNAIKTSPSSFDTRPDALIKLKQAGVSDAVLQAMQEAGATPQTEASNASATSTEEAPSFTPTQPTFSVRHRHSPFQTSDSSTHYCSGDLSLSSDGTVRFDCNQTDDPSGRCDHISIPSGSLLQAKVGDNGALHLASKKQGNFDFFGDPGTIKEALTAITPLTGIAPAASTVPPPAPAASNCGDFESCMKKAAASLEQSQGAAEALAEFQKASELDPSKSEPLTGKGFAYLQMAQYAYVSAMWNKALQSGATLSINVCHAGIACGDTGNFLLSTKEVSFVNKKGEKEFAVAPSAIASVEAAPHGFGSTYYWQLQIQGKKNYRFYYGPKGVRCKSNFICPEPGLTQQKVVADYLHDTLDKLKAGTLDSQPGKL